MTTANTELLPMHRADAPSALAVRDPEELLRFAVEKGADVGTIERLMTVRRELNAEKAKAAYDAAMAAFQAECPVIEKNKGVPDRSGATAYKYAPFEHIIATVKPFLQQHGFSYTLDTDTESAQGWVIAKCLITHCGGHFTTSTAKFPLGTKTGIMSETQVYAAALTFASRRVFCNAFGIVTAGEDMDGRTANPKPAGPSALQPSEAETKALAKELWDTLRSVRGDKHNWNEANQWLWREDILDGGIPEEAPHLPPARFRQVIDMAKERLNV